MNSRVDAPRCYYLGKCLISNCHSLVKSMVISFTFNEDRVLSVFFSFLDLCVDCKILLLSIATETHSTIFPAGFNIMQASLIEALRSHCKRHAAAAGVSYTSLSPVPRNRLHPGSVGSCLGKTTTHSFRRGKRR